jgi:dihydroneopterin aldolase
MDKIIMKNLVFYGYHGVLKEEKILGQKFYIDIELYLPLQKSGITDKVEDTVNYAEVYALVKKIVTEKRFNLMEALGEEIIQSILKKFNKVCEIRICIRKPEAPVDGVYDYFGIEIRRLKNG